MGFWWMYFYVKIENGIYKFINIKLNTIMFKTMILILIFGSVLDLRKRQE